MKRVLTYITLAVVLAVGCSKKELPQPDMPGGYTPSDIPISFATEDNWGDEPYKLTTKGAVSTSDKFVSFTAFAYYLPSIDGAVAEWSDEATPNFMYNQMVERELKVGGSFTEWGYSPKKYWSENPNDRFRFFACAPHDCWGVELSNNTDKGAPRFTVAPHNRPHWHQDFMTAEAHLKSKRDGVVTFNFKHKLAQAKIYVAHKGAEADTVKILGITVKGMRKSGDLIYDEAKNKYVWEHQQSGSNEAFVTATYNFWATQDYPNELDIKATINHLASQSSNISDYTDPSLVDEERYMAHMFLVPQDPIEKIEFILFFDYYNDANNRRVQSFQKFILKNSSLIEGKTKAYLLLIDPVSVGYGEITTTVEPWDKKTIDDNDNDWVVE